MYSCANQPRGCRGRVNTVGGKCSDCVVLNLGRPSSPAPSPFAQNREYRRPIRLEFSSRAAPKAHEV